MGAVMPKHGLVESDFRLTCLSGFGDGWNHYAHSMAWFQDKLYVGTTRATMAFLKINAPVPNYRPWPVECPDDIYALDRRAEIWEYTPETDTWVLAFRAPFVKDATGVDVPRFIGYRGMTVFQGKSDTKPCLYVSTWAPQRAGTAELLRTEDGREFIQCPRPPWDKSIRAFRSLQIFNGRVHTSPTASGRTTGFAQDSLSSDPTIYATDDPLKGNWVRASEPGFGNPANLTVFEMEAFNGHLYGGTVNAQTGFEIWKTKGGDTAPYHWTRVIGDGSGRGILGEAVGSFCEFKGALYAGTGVLNGGFHRAMRIGPAAAELIRIFPDDSWEMVVGESRIVDGRVQYPLSGFSAGYDNLFNGYFWRQCVHQGHLYVGTLCWANLLPYLPAFSWPDDIHQLMQKWGWDNIVRRFGGFELWRTADGIHWEPVTRNGFGNKYNWGVRNFMSTKFGLFVGTTNPFGPTVAVERNGEWTYVPNARGGCEVWLGAPAAVTP
ncbi:MAG TPA: hypothetical protein VJM11_17030 [Nevskiaceae bacterium]|nr:hypothetical protein [Nevskiaceae bacterium]